MPMKRGGLSRLYLVNERANEATIGPTVMSASPMNQGRRKRKAALFCLRDFGAEVPLMRRSSPRALIDGLVFGWRPAGGGLVVSSGTRGLQSSSLITAEKALSQVLETFLSHEPARSQEAKRRIGA